MTPSRRDFLEADAGRPYPNIRDFGPSAHKKRLAAIARVAAAAVASPPADGREIPFNFSSTRAAAFDLAGVAGVPVHKCGDFSLFLPPAGPESAEAVEK